MHRKIIGILVCMLLLSMTFSVATAQKMIKEYEKDENQGINGLNNSPPTDPVITGPDTVRKNWIFLVRVVSTDPDDDQIYYRLKVGEGDNPSDWIGPFDSGVKYVTGMGVFGYTGDLTIGFQAKDEHDAESSWSYHTITFFTKARSVNTPFLKFLQCHPYLFQLLRLLLQRLGLQ